MWNLQPESAFGDPSNPLLVSVRSGATVSMPGMMDTVLNLGLDPETEAGLAHLTANPRFAADAYRRFVQLFGKIVLGVDGSAFEHVMDAAKGEDLQDTDLSTEQLHDITTQFKEIVRQHSGMPFPDDPMAQLREATAAVFRSWNGRRAVDYRRLNHISDSLGTAVTVQMMVFGNMGADSATGVAFSRNPSTGENVLYGEYLVNAQGEDVVAGVRTPRPLAEMRQEWPQVYDDFQQIAHRLEQHYKDIQDMEFTIERGQLYMLQTRIGKRTGHAAVRIAVDLVNEGVIDRGTAVLRVEPAQVEQLLHPTLVPEARGAARMLTRGLPRRPEPPAGRSYSIRTKPWRGQRVVNT